MPKVKTAQSFDTNAESKFHLSAQGFPFKTRPSNGFPTPASCGFGSQNPLKITFRINRSLN